jgi:hypothetical protein
MSKSVSNLPDPAYWLRQFIFNELKKYPSDEVAVVSNQTFVPISPSLSQAAEADFYESLVQSTGLEQPLWIQYDKLMRFRTNPFYRIKKEQLILTINHPDIDIADNVTTIIEQLLDREDAAAQDLNKWASENFGFDVEKPHNVFFHKIRVFKADESRDLVELNSVNLAFARTRLIIEFDYHASDRAYYANTANPEYDQEYK